MPTNGSALAWVNRSKRRAAFAADWPRSLLVRGLSCGGFHTLTKSIFFLFREVGRSTILGDANKLEAAVMRYRQKSRQGGWGTGVGYDYITHHMHHSSPCIRFAPHVVLYSRFPCGTVCNWICANSFPAHCFIPSHRYCFRTNKLRIASASLRTFPGIAWGSALHCMAHLVCWSCSSGSRISRDQSHRARLEVFTATHEGHWQEKWGRKTFLLVALSATSCRPPIASYTMYKYVA